MATHEFIKELTESGLTEHQSETIARHQSLIINENLATKQDVDLLRKEVKQYLDFLRQEVSQDIGSLKQDMTLLRQEVSQDIGALRQDMTLLRHDLIIKLGIMLIGGWVAAIGIILGVMSVMLK